MAYGAKSSDIKEGSYLSYGEYENGRIALVDVDPAKKRVKGEETDDVCDVIFTHKGGKFQLRTFNPDTGTDEVKKEKNSEYASKLFAYIAKKLTGKEQEVPTTISSFEELTVWFLETIGPKEVYSKVPVNFKLVGNEYNGKANIQVTKYFGWLERVDSEKKPKFSPNEIASNNAYDKFLREKTPKTKTSESSDDSGGTEDLAF